MYYRKQIPTVLLPLENNERFSVSYSYKIFIPAEGTSYVGKERPFAGMRKGAAADETQRI